MALCGVAVLASCEDDRDSNPVLDTTASPVAFTLNTPEFGGVLTSLDQVEVVSLVWSQPQLTDKNAPLAAVGSYGLVYQVQVSKNGEFTKSFDEALAEAGDVEGAVAVGQNYAALNTFVKTTNEGVKASEFNLAVNKALAFAKEETPSDVTVYARVLAILARTNADDVVLGESNVVTLRVAPSWVDVYAKPVEASYLWVPGNGNGWAHAVCPVLKSEDGKTYTGYAYMDGEFKFTPQGNWDAEFNNSHFTTVSDNIDLGDAAGGNINFTGEAGMYFLTVNTEVGALQAELVHWGIVGGFNSWSVDEGKIVEMTYDKDSHCLSADVDFEGGSEWKFARDYAWTFNFGGELDNLEQDGANLSHDGAHTIQLFIERADENPHAVVK